LFEELKVKEREITELEVSIKDLDVIIQKSNLEIDNLTKEIPDLE